jgi:hypothetical protein
MSARGLQPFVQWARKGGSVGSVRRTVCSRRTGVSFAVFLARVRCALRVDSASATSPGTRRPVSGAVPLRQAARTQRPPAPVLASPIARHPTAMGGETQRCR